LGNVGKTVSYAESIEANGVQQTESLRELISDMKAGSVDTLLVLGGNPAFATPADLGFTDAMAKVKLRVHLSLYQDETSALCHWHIPEAHFLESWSDSRAYDGTVTIVQP
jgi:molybdopterin-containing oxidoreductase family iron-sulfur binding subunit